MATAWCKGWGQEIEIPGGIRSGEIFDCPNWAGLSLRASESNGAWSVAEVKRASCAVGGEVIFLPDDIQPDDVIECHGARQRVTYEYGAYALELDASSRREWRKLECWKVPPLSEGGAGLDERCCPLSHCDASRCAEHAFYAHRFSFTLELLGTSRPE